MTTLPNPRRHQPEGLAAMRTEAEIRQRIAELSQPIAGRRISTSAIVVRAATVEALRWALGEAGDAPSTTEGMTTMPNNGPRNPGGDQ
jgi:hypothetical protein